MAAALLVLAAAPALGQRAEPEPPSRSCLLPEILPDVCLGGSSRPELIVRATDRELVARVPITRRAKAVPRAVLSVRLPRIGPGDRVFYRAEVILSNTCAERVDHCIGRHYGFSPRLAARPVLAAGSRAAGGGTRPLGKRRKVRCGQRRPNRNHHCRLTVRGKLTVGDRPQLPCATGQCRLNLVVDASHPAARGGELVVVGADRPDGSIEGGHARLSVASVRRGAAVAVQRWRTAKRRIRTLPSSGGHRVVLSRRLPDPRAGDVLLIEARQRAAIRALPYFQGSRVIIAGRPRATRPGRFARRRVTHRARLTPTNGFNCTPGRSGFTSPCLTEKAGIVRIKRRVDDGQGKRRPLFANLVMRTSPRLVQAPNARLQGRPTSAFAPAKIRPGGRLTVTRLRRRR